MTQQVGTVSLRCM